MKFEFVCKLTMNEYLVKFIESKFSKPGKALDLGAGDFKDVEGLILLGWNCKGLDKNKGIDLELPYFSERIENDLVFSNYVLHLVNNKQQIINTAYNYLKKGGWVFLHTFDKSDISNKSNISEEIIKEMLKKEGFKNIYTSVFNFKDEEHQHRILEATAQK